MRDLIYGMIQAYLKFVKDIFFFFCTRLCEPIACSLFGGGIPYHNSGYNITRLFPSLC